MAQYVLSLPARPRDRRATTTSEKAADARAAGASQVVISTDTEAMGALALRFDLVLSTVPTRHAINPYIALLKRDCTLVLVGALEPLEPVNHGQVAFHRRGSPAR